jgi:hypothetical protein
MAGGVAAIGGCSSTNNTRALSDGGTNGIDGGSCAAPITPADDSYCASCTPASGAQTCTAAMTVDACCTWVAAPTETLQRGTNLVYFGGSDPNAVDVSCLATPPTAGAVQMVTVQGHVKLFSSGNDSAGVTVQAYQANSDGSLGAAVGTAYTTTMDDATDPPQMPLVTYLTNCPEGGCKFRSYSLTNVPTETPLIIKTTDALMAGTWADLYDYNIYIPDADVTSNTYAYDATCLAATDIGVVGAAAGITPDPTKGLVAGEVHDCGNVRLAGATVNTDQPHEGQIWYFTSNEDDPLPDQSATATSVLSLFGGFNLPVGTPIRVSAIGEWQNSTVLLGTDTIQGFAGGVSVLTFHGRRPYQQ